MKPYPSLVNIGTLVTSLLESRGLFDAPAAKRLAVPLAYLKQIKQGQARITERFALALEELGAQAYHHTSHPPQHLLAQDYLQLQTQYLQDAQELNPATPTPSPSV